MNRRLQFLVVPLTCAACFYPAYWLAMFAVRAVGSIVLGGGPQPDQPYPKLCFQKGVNFTAEGPNGYSPEFAVKVLDELPRYGVNAIALVPYGFERKNHPAIRFGGSGGSWEPAELIGAVAALARQRKIKVLLKPQIWTNVGYPGDIAFSKPEDRAAWFADYRRFVEYYAALATKIHADLFCIGVEFAQMVRYEGEWRGLIAHARELYRGPLVYAANSGPEFESVAFWDALDYIGLNNYYPLPDDLSTDAVVSKVEQVQRKYQRPVIFTEAGFSSFKSANREPWAERRGEPSMSDQARCYEAVLRAFYRKPWFQGVYWWKVGTDGFGGPQDGSHTPWGKPAMDVVAKWYLNSR
jgi:hypothetical protein